MAKKKSKTNQKESKKNAGASQEPDPLLTSSGEGPGFLRPEDGHGRGNVFYWEPVQQPAPSASHQPTSICPRVREYQRGAGKTTTCTKYAYYHQKKRYEPAQYVWILSWMVLLIS
ncbi:Uncharacterized protein Rs2_45751 [Raphanus sativus]|nr:Uncharacterized protein Rs2_45751 [Raphanus sativus]